MKPEKQNFSIYVKHLSKFLNLLIQVINMKFYLGMIRRFSKGADKVILLMCLPANER
jgi:hypothetical protein